MSIRFGLPCGDPSITTLVVDEEIASGDFSSVELAPVTFSSGRGVELNRSKLSRANWFWIIESFCGLVRADLNSVVAGDRKVDSSTALELLDCPKMKG